MQAYAGPDPARCGISRGEQAAGVELWRMRALIVIAACAAGLLVGGPWVACAAAALAPLSVGFVRSLRPR